MNVKVVLAVGGAFIAGASSAVFAVRGYFKKKYEAKADEEIRQVRKAYHDIFEERVKSGEIDTVEPRPIEKPEPTTADVEKQIENRIAHEYYTFSEDYETPEIIDPASYGVYEDYDMIDLTYYVNEKILVDELDQRLDIAKVVGEHNLDSFHHPYPDGTTPTSIFIKDDKKMCYYEVDRCDEPYDGPEKEE